MVIYLDTYKKMSIMPYIKLRQCDKLVDMYQFVIFDDGMETDLSKFTSAEFLGTNAKGQMASFILNLPESGNVINAVFPDGMSGVVGKYQNAYIRLSTDDGVTSTCEVNVLVLPAVDLNAEQAEKYHTVLDDVLVQYNETWNSFLADRESDYADLAERMNALDARYETNEDKLNALQQMLEQIGVYSKVESDEKYATKQDLSMSDQQNNLMKSRLFFGDNNVFIGHRGCSGFAPENSKKAFELAYHHGMAGIETDLTNTTDGVIFCYHDVTLDTKTDGTGNPRELTWDYVSSVKLTKANGYDAYPDTKIATLDDYLSTAKKYNLIIFPEIAALSTEGLIHEALDKIYNYGLESQCVVLVNKWNYQIVKDYAPNLIRGLIPGWGVTSTEDIDFCVTNGIEICGAAFSAGLTTVPQSFIDYANSKGIYLYGYIINTTKDLSRIKDLGIKFIATDYFGGEN